MVAGGELPYGGIAARSFGPSAINWSRQYRMTRPVVRRVRWAGQRRSILADH